MVKGRRDVGCQPGPWRQSDVIDEKEYVARSREPLRFVRQPFARSFFQR
jgi:hypothetical protein